LVRLAWDVHTLGVRTSVELSEQEPVLLVSRPSRLPLTITAQLRGEEWWLAWGRSAENSVRALADDAADRIWQAVR
ncbi:hypothetical protein, partial [Streptosporangium sp. NPDC048865]|uniref:hypothetical protein n=1 Tax=Streptosporangium sp. NPDC048865 TaxID=3155766 RepID=UPI003423D712